MFSVAKMAAGNIRGYQLNIAILSILDFLFAWLVLGIGMVPEWIYAAPIIVAIAKTAASIAFVRKDLSYSLKNVLYTIFLPVSAVAIIACFIPGFLYCMMTPGWERFLSVLGSSILCTTSTALFIGFSPDERRKLKGYLRSFISSRFKK